MVLWDQIRRGTRRPAYRVERGAVDKMDPLVEYVPVYVPVYREGKRIR